MEMRRIENLPKFVKAGYEAVPLDFGTIFFNLEHAPFSGTDVFYAATTGATWVISTEGP